MMTPRYGMIEPGLVREPLRDEFGNYPAMAKALLADQIAPHSFDVFSIVSGAALPPPDAFEGYLILGSAHGVGDGLPWFPALAQWIEQVVMRRIPLVGICFGHQAIARALGGEVGRSPGGWNAGVGDYQIVNAGPADTVAGHTFHQDQVLKAPAGATAVLTSASCPLAGLVYEQGPVFSVQFHPEFEPAYARSLIELTAADPVPREVAEAALATLDRPVHRQRFARAIAAALSGAHGALVVDHLAGG